jgi:glyoxylase-like metal-dependent hydrolase (beta-lactamase superfamily II)
MEQQREREADMSFSVDVLRLGRFNVPAWEVFWMEKFDAVSNDGLLPLTLNMVVARDENSVVIINTGPAPEKRKFLSDTWVKLFGKDAGLFIDEDDYVENALASLGIAPADVDYVVVTPFQTYSIGNVNLFSNARFCLSRKGWTELLSPRYKNHPHDTREMCIPRENLDYLLHNAWDRVVLLDDEDTVVEGIDTFWTGVHHRASLAVKIDSSKGKVIASDSFFYYENITERWPIGINESMYEALDAYERIAAEADIIIPLYDPRVFENHPNGKVAE